MGNKSQSVPTEEIRFSLENLESKELFVSGLLDNFETPESRESLVERLRQAIAVVCPADSCAAAMLEDSLVENNDYSTDDVEFVQLYLGFLEAMCVPWAHF